MKLLKRLSRNDTLREITCRLAAGYIRLVWRTGRWTVIGGEIPNQLWDAKQPFVGCFWHARMLIMPCSWDYGKAAIHMLHSPHPDGKFAARTVNLFGIQNLFGSSRKGGSAGLRSMLRVLKAGDCVAITPDGPRGPRMRVSPGIVAIARLGGVPMVPVTFATTRRKVLGTWDRMVIPLPFGRGVIAWGEPVVVAHDADETAQEAARRRLEDRLNALTDAVDRQCGCPTTDPAPMPEAPEP